MNKIIAVGVIAMMFASCADSKEFTIDGKQVTIEPYGWYSEEDKNDSIVYKTCVGNVVLSIILCETIIVPVVLTGGALYEPVRKKINE